MAHFAELDDDNIVKRVIVVNNNELIENGVEDENKGILFCQMLLGGKWKQTSYNSSFRKNFAGAGYSYDNTRDAFISPKLFNSWLLDEATCQWKAPVEYPSDDKFYSWDENSLSWVVPEIK
jgi:hypothetical protein